MHYICMNTKCTVNDSPGYDVLLEIDMYMYVRGVISLSLEYKVIICDFEGLRGCQGVNTLCMYEY